MSGYSHTLTLCLLPPQPSIFLDEEVANNKEGIKDDTDAAADDIATAEDIATATADNDDKDATMPPKVKPLPTKLAKKDLAAASVKPPPPPPPPPPRPPSPSMQKTPSPPITMRRSLRLCRCNILRQRNNAEE